MLQRRERKEREDVRIHTLFDYTHQTKRKREKVCALLKVPKREGDFSQVYIKQKFRESERDFFFSRLEEKQKEKSDIN